jgi:hypothetical protein
MDEAFSHSVTSARAGVAHWHHDEGRDWRRCLLPSGPATGDHSVLGAESCGQVLALELVAHLGAGAHGRVLR